MVPRTAIADEPLPNRCVSGDPPIGNYQLILLDEAHLNKSIFALATKAIS
jgi:hypothetical protein